MRQRSELPLGTVETLAVTARSGHPGAMPTVLEFWPEHDGGPLGTWDGTTAELASLGLSAGLRDRLDNWNSGYDDGKLPFETNHRPQARRGIPNNERRSTGRYGASGSAR